MICSLIAVAGLDGVKRIKLNSSQASKKIARDGSYNMYDNKKADCKAFLFASYGAGWLKMTNKEKAFQWDNLMTRRRVVGQRVFANPYQ
jgi:hypothetical protein